VSNPKFKIWHNQKVQEVLTGKKIEEACKEMIRPENIKVEVKKKGRWVPEPNSLPF